MLTGLAAALLAASFCSEAPTQAAPMSVGSPSNGRLEGAAQVLHQPTDAPPHDDHLHLRLRCTETEGRAGCRE